MDNPSYKRDDVDLPEYNESKVYPTLNGSTAEPVDNLAKEPDKEKKPNGPIKQSFKRTKSKLIVYI